VNYGHSYREAHEIQRVLKTRIDDPNTVSKDIAACARAWDVLEDRKREIRGKPKTGAFRPKVTPTPRQSYQHAMEIDPS